MKFLLIPIFFISFHTFAQFMGAGSSSGTGNPASIFCEKNEGKIIIRTSSQGQHGICNIEEGKLVNIFNKHKIDWQVYLNEDQKNSVGNPATLLCEALGGESFIIDTIKGQVGFCNIEEWQLWRIFHQ